MSEHETIREWLPLAVAGVLEAEEQRQLQRHLAVCHECAVELERWGLLAGSLKRLPTPRAPANLVERVRARLEAVSVAQAEYRANQRALAFLVLFAWTVTLASWPVVRLVSDGMAAWLDLQFVHTWFWLVGYTALSWLGAAVAAVMLGLRQRPARRAL